MAASSNKVASGGSEEARLIGARVRGLRQQHGTSLRELARRVGVSAGTMSALETGQTLVERARLEEIAGALGIPIAELVRLEPEHAPLDLGASERLAIGSWREYPPLRLGSALTGALSCFVRVGYHGASMREIAEAAGLSVAGIYHYYESKEQMLSRLMDLTMSDLLHRSHAAVREEMRPVARFAAVVECLVLFHTQRRDLAFVAASEMRSLSAQASRALRDARNEQQRMIDAEVLAAREEGLFHVDDPTAASRAVGTMCTAVAGWFTPDGPASPSEVARQHVRFALSLMGMRSAAENATSPET